MNFDDYFARRNDLTVRVLVEVPEVAALPGDRRLVGVGGACLLAAAGMQAWALQALTDPGYFSRTSTFVACMLLAGVCILVATKVAVSCLTGYRIRTRETSRERTVASLISADRMIAQKLASPKGEAVGG